MENLKKNLSSFFDSYYYPCLVALTVFICHTFSFEFVGILLLFASAAVAVMVCDDLRVIISPILFVTYIVSYKSFLDGSLGSTTFLVVVIASLCLFFVSTFAHFFINKKLERIKELPKSRLFWGIIAISVAFLLNGFFNFSNYTAINAYFALLLVFFLAFMFFLFYAGSNARKDTLEYLLFVFYVASILLMCELGILYARDASFVDGKIIKESLILGWGVWNNVGGMLTIFLPVHFYYASTKKHGYIFYGTAILTYAFIALTLSRSSLLFASIISLACVTIICIKGKNIKINRIITLCVAGVGIVGIILLWDKISVLLSSYLNQGFGDNGRFDLYKHGIENFLSHPIFGGGFNSCAEDYFGHGIEPNRYHNTFIELIATCGIVGIGAYIFHRYQTIKLFIEKRTDYTIWFSSLCVLALLLTSLLDNHIFNLYPTMYYAFTLCAIEKHKIDN